MGNSLSNNYDKMYQENLILKQENIDLKKKIKANKIGINYNKINFNKILDKTIDNYVDNMSNENKICYLCPNYIEKKIYKNTCGIMFCFFNEVANNSSINLVNHKIEINLKPDLKK